jgi:hypothetical protein
MLKRSMYSSSYSAAAKHYSVCYFAFSLMAVDNELSASPSNHLHGLPRGWSPVALEMHRRCTISN